MLEKFKKSINTATDSLKEQAVQLTDSMKETVREKTTELSDAVREKTNQLFDDWLQIFPNLENYGLKVMSFGFCMGISPALDVELRGSAADFTLDRLELILAEVEGNRALSTVFKAIKTTYSLHAKTGSDYHNFDVILLKLSIRITPEVKVYLGQPLLL
jgi:hypothetical protein